MARRGGRTGSQTRQVTSSEHRLSPVTADMNLLQCDEPERGIMEPAAPAVEAWLARHVYAGLDLPLRALTALKA